MSNLALHWCEARAKINMKTENLTPVKLQTWEFNTRVNFSASRFSGDFSRSKWNVAPLWLFLTVLSLFCVTRPGETAWQSFTLYGSNDVFPHRESLFRVGTMDDVIWGNESQSLLKVGVNRQFQVKTTNLKIAIYLKLQTWRSRNVNAKRELTIPLRGWSFQLP